MELTPIKLQQAQARQIRLDRIKQQPKQLIEDGYVFNRDDKTGYYLSTGKIPLHGRVKRWRLHVYVWAKANGLPSVGVHIHHIDEDKGNNCITNLQILPKRVHGKYHGDHFTIERKQFQKALLGEYAQPLAKEWHKSQVGKEWHKQNGKKTWEQRTPHEYTCLVCGKVFSSKKYGQVKYCCNNCRAHARRLSGVDTEQRICLLCGKTFAVNKYSSRSYCSRTCSQCARRSPHACKN